MNRKKRSDAKFDIETTSFIPPRYLYIYIIYICICSHLKRGIGCRLRIQDHYSLYLQLMSMQVQMGGSKLIDSGGSSFWIYMHMIKRYTSITTH